MVKLSFYIDKQSRKSWFVGYPGLKRQAQVKIALIVV
jgi:hypothetical protein